MKGLLHAGGKKFSADSNEMAILALIYVGMHHPVGAVAAYADYYYTRPNTTYEDAADVRDFPGSYKGTLEEINGFLYKL